MNKYYVRDWGRPCGVEPVIFTSKEEADINDEDAMFLPCIEEFDTELDARRFIKENSDD